MTTAHDVLARLASAALTALVLSACSASPGPGPRASAGGGSAEAGSPGPAAAAPSLYGRWHILEVNGAPIRPRHGGPSKNPPYLSFTRGSFGGNSGCNSFGGNGLLVGGRWFAEPPLSTAMGCGDVGVQERAIYGIVSGGPAVSFDGPDAAMLRTATGSLRLGRVGPAPDEDAPREAMMLAGTRWQFRALDGVAIDLPGERLPPRLAFEADRWTLETPCLVQSGAWRQEEAAVLLKEGTGTERPCRADLQPASQAWVRAIGGRLHYVVGMNGEFVLASGEHWATGSADISFARDEPASLSGQWRVVSVNGATPPPSERPAELAFGPRGFAVWDGCRHSEGVAIAADRQLFTHGSGVVTMANCPRDTIRQTINAVVASRPRIGRTAGGGIALVGRPGTLRLERISTQPFGTTVDSRLRSGWKFDLLGASGPLTRLTLGPGERFDVTLACGTMQGRWRNERSPEGWHVRFSPERTPAACDNNPEAAGLYNFFTGDVRVAVGPNRDIALFVSRGTSRAARFVPGS